MIVTHSADRSVAGQVGDPEDRFSRVAAHLRVAKNHTNGCSDTVKIITCINLKRYHSEEKTTSFYTVLNVAKICTDQTVRLCLYRFVPIRFHKKADGTLSQSFAYHVTRLVCFNFSH